jgi:hypothetical protein
MSRGNLENEKKKTINNQPHTQDWMMKLDDYRLSKKKDQGKCFKTYTHKIGSSGWWVEEDLFSFVEIPLNNPFTQQP